MFSFSQCKKFQVCNEGAVSILVYSGAGESEAESERGERETAGPAGALQEVFDTT